MFNAIIMTSWKLYTRLFHLTAAAGAAGVAEGDQNIGTGSPMSAAAICAWGQHAAGSAYAASGATRDPADEFGARRSRSSQSNLFPNKVNPFF